MGKLFWVDPRLASAPTEPHVLHWIERQITPGGTFLDVGAHFGWMSLVACRGVGGSGRVIAFEPSPPLADLLRYHKRMNGLIQLEVVSKAVSCANEPDVPFALVSGGESFLNSLVLGAAESGNVLARNQSAETIGVDTITLDNFCLEAGVRPDLIKIDVEGAELLVLRGAVSTLAESHPALIVAVHPPWMPYGQSESDLFELLARFGYRVLDSHLVPYQGTSFGDYLCTAG